jgi:hypothetical protein
MKTTKTIFALLLIAATTFTGCKKPEKGETGPAGPTGAQGPQGAPGPDAQTFTYTLTFTSSDTYQTYYGITGFDANDMIVTYVLDETYGGEDFYVQTPYVVQNYVNIYAQVGENTGLVFVNTVKADGTAGSPWASTSTLKFKSVLIKSRAVKAHPEVNYSDYAQVIKTFGLKK